MSMRPGQLTRPRVTAAAILLAVFLAGGMAGAAVLHVTSARAEAIGVESPRSAPDGRRGRGEPGSDRMVDLLTTRLDLSTEQQAIIREILDRRQQAAEEILDEIEPTMRRHMEETGAEIREVLTPEQQAEFDRFDADRREQMDRRRPSSPRRGR